MHVQRIRHYAILIFLLISSSGYSQDSTPTVPKDFYSTPGLNPFEERVNDNFNESISPFNGILHLSYTDVFIPGNGGMDIAVNRRYSTSDAIVSVNRSVYGVGWDISFGKLIYSSGNSLNPEICSTGLAGLFDTKDNPIFETPDGSNELLVANDGSMASATNALMVSKGRYMLACEPGQDGDGNAVNYWAVYAPNGTRYELGFIPGISDSDGRIRAYVSKISDRNGNEIQIKYAVNSVFTVYIKSISDPDDGRNVLFTYHDEGLNTIRLNSIRTPTQIWQYNYQGVYEYNDAVGALDGFLSYPNFDNYHLLSVRRPDGREWGYEYFTEELVPGESYIYQNWRHLIKEVRYPFGSQINYEYQDVFFGETSIFYEKPHQVIKKKIVHTLAGDRISGLAPISPGDDERNVWEYYFYPGGGVVNRFDDEGVLEISETTDLTIINNPLGVEAYHHYGYDGTTEGNIWRVGLLMYKIVTDNQGVRLSGETNYWSSQDISTEAYWNGRGPNFRDSTTKAPLLISRGITQSGVGYKTEFTDFDGFGNPGYVIRDGTSVPDSIDTNITYHIDSDLWIVNQTQDEEIVGVGEIKRIFDDKGNIKQIDEYGTVTNFTYTHEGDINTETNAKNQTIIYSDYFRGIARRIEYPENKTITREVNDTGTVNSETSGRGFVTKYEYDSMNRLVFVDTPVHADVTISYTTSNSNLIRILTRGNFQKITKFNSLLKPVQIEKVDTVTNQEITTVTEYDILGRPTFVSKPSYGSYPSLLTESDRALAGITTTYDAIGKILSVRNPDGSERLYCYYNQACVGEENPALGAVEVIDERGNKTVNHYAGYGTPDEKHLIRISSPEDIETLITYDKLNNVTQILQGEKDGIGHVRRYNYDSRFFKVSEDHPEIGHIELGRDAIGNLTTRQIKNSIIAENTHPDSEITSYSYDELNRLKTIDYPIPTSDVTFTYDADDNLKSVINDISSRIYEYDANGNLLNETISIEGDSYSLVYGYNNLDQLDSIIYPSGRIVDYGNDAFGRPTSVSTYVDQVNYYPGGQIKSMSYNNGFSTTFELNEREWIKSIRVNGAGNPGLVDLAYGYDGKGNVKNIIDNTGINTRTMKYDGVDRLVEANGMWGTGAFSYDHEDNMRTRIIDTASDTYLTTNNRMHEMQRNGAVVFASVFDVYGNQLNTANHDLIFDDANNLIEAQVSSAISNNLPPIIFKYDGDKHRVYRENAEGVTHYVYSKGESVLAEVDTTTNTSKENIYLGSQIVASVKGNDDPVAKIVAVKNVPEKSPVTLDGTTSFDPDGDIVGYQWVQISGVDVALDGIGPGIVEFETPLVSKNETLVFELTVTDDRGAIDSAEVSVIVELTDTDSDGLSDLWESIFFPSNLNELQGNGDYDHDGITDLDEFLNNSDPTVFNDLDTPNGVLVSSGVSDLTLSWPSIERANRYSVYWSTDNDVSLSDTNRFYSSSSPFIHDSLPSGQYFYYVVVAERVDVNGALLGGSNTSLVVNGKAGWKVWTQNVLHSTVFGTDARLEINQQGVVNASWSIAPDFSGGGEDEEGGDEGGGSSAGKQSTSYSQNSGWSTVVDGNDLAPVTNTNIRLVEENDGIYAEYYTVGSGWGNRELIYEDTANEWKIRHSKANNKGEWLVILRDISNLQEPLALTYSPENGWSTAQSLQIFLPGEVSVKTDALHFSDDGVGHLIYSNTDGLKDLIFKSGEGWQPPVSLGLPGNHVSASSPSGYVHIVSAHADAASTDLSQVSSIYYDPSVGWSQIIPVISTPFSVDNPNSYSPNLSVDVDNSGQAVFAIHRSTTEQFYIVKQFLPETGWQDEMIRPVIEECEFDDIPVSILANPHHADSAIITEPRVSLDVKISERGDWSILSQISSYSPRYWVLVVSRFEPQSGWLDDRVMHCPALELGFENPSSVQAVNSYGTTFVLWAFADSGEALGNTKVLTNKYELLRGVQPVASAGVDQSVTEGDPVTLDASLSTDADNFIESYRWTQVSGAAVNIADSDQEVATFFAPLVDSDEILEFELQITDSVGNIATDTVEVIVSNLSTTELGVALATNRPSPLVQGDQLTLTAQGQGGSGGVHEFLYRVRPVGGDTSQPWEILQDFTGSNSLIWDTTGYAGKYKVQAVVREVGNEAVEVKDNLTYWVNSANPVTHVSRCSFSIT